MKKTNKPESARVRIADTLGRKTMAGLDRLGIIPVAEDYYRHLLDRLALHEEYLQIIRDLRDGQQSTLRCAMERAHALTAHPTTPRRSGAVPHDQPAPRRSSSHAQPSGHQP